ncbi:uncharacterized protein LOC134209429 [Armigeres subalbatus]|uniref:uncharacterized protein LOC134209429 n=1 Tax=Armigeres subalbatus TaxID=124917 RepID=UPI002ED20C1E
MSIFDPLGLFSNVLIGLRILLQEIWWSAINWDDEIPDSLHEKWDQWLHILPQLQDISIQRCYRSLTSINSDMLIQLHTFVDASELGYAAVVYLRFKQGNTVECMIVGAKSLVALFKFVSIPMLELQSAIIGTRLANSICEALSFKITDRFFWTDARNVLCWLRSDHRQYSPYVGWRVSEILDSTAIKDWKWISSKDNVTDEATKWRRSVDLDSQTAVPSSNIFGMEPAAKNSSSDIRLKGTERNTGPFTKDELLNSSNLLYREAQSALFSEEILILSKSEMSKKAIPKSSSIFTLNPFLDGKRVLGMHGRISACEYATRDAQNPIILPRDHHITKLLVRDYHLRYHHRNHETVLNEIRQVYRIPKLRPLLREVRSECQTCKNQLAFPKPPPMADLSTARLAAYTRPFSYVGIDYFGPMCVAVGRRSAKRWGVLITCLTIRAIHLEVAHSLTADSCIMALRSFMSRRGVPILIYSDRGTNFIAASKELREALREMDQQKVIREITSQHTEWTFLPPASPHMSLCLGAPRSDSEGEPAKDATNETPHR